MKSFNSWLSATLFLVYFLCSAAWAGDDGHLLVRGTPSALKKVKISPLSKSQFELSIVKNDLFEMLVSKGDEGRIVPGVAESWSLSDDHLSWTFHLRRDAYWSDGVPVTAGDFIFAFTYWTDSERKGKVTSSDIVGFAPSDSRDLGLTALDDYTLKIDMVSPGALELLDLTSTSLAPLPRHAAPESVMAWSDWPEHPANGPYALVGMDGQNGAYQMEANPYARDELRGAYPRVEHRLLPVEVLISQFNDGELDVLTNSNDINTDHFVQNGAQIVPTEESLYYYTINKRKPHLADARVRRALIVATDPASIVQRIFPDSKFVVPAYYLTRGERLGLSNPRRPDLDLARKLMTEAGYSDSNRLQLTITASFSELNDSIAHLLKEQLYSIYIDAIVDTNETNFRKFKKRRDAGEFDLARIRMTPGDQSIRGMYQKCNVREGFYCGYLQHDEYANIMFQELLAQDEQTKKAQILKANEIVVNDYSVLPIFHQFGRMMLAKNVALNPDKPRSSRPRSSVFMPRSASNSASNIVENTSQLPTSTSE